MILKTLSLHQQCDHRTELSVYESPLLTVLRWFWRFSQFYGEYAVRSPQGRCQWVAKQMAKRR